MPAPLRTSHETIRRRRPEPPLLAFLARTVREHTIDETVKFLVRAALYPKTLSQWLETADDLCRSVGVSAPPLDLVKKVQKRVRHRRFGMANGRC